jgi:hypothetical protein
MARLRFTMMRPAAARIAAANPNLLGRIMANTRQFPNQIDLVLPDDDRAAVEAAFKTVEDRLHPHLVSLRPDERRDLLKMGPRTSDFVNRTMSFMRAMPQYVPAFLDIEAFQRDLDGVRLLGELQHRINQSNDMIDDSAMVAGSEAFTAALSCYDSLKSAARRGLPDAIAAVDDLGARLPLRRATKPPADTAAPAGQAPGAGEATG